MRVLVACEFSGIVRDAFLARGHDAWSCDLLPTERERERHYQGDVMDIINYGWDMMIAHPPCTYLSYAGTRHWNAPGRIKKRLEALEFFRILWESPIDKICIENPKGCASPIIAKFTQEIQPYYWGDNEMKTTWLWLKNLPQLGYSIDDGLFHKKTGIDRPEPIKRRMVAGKMKNYYYTEKTRNPYERARFWPGIAKAMAEQWG
jgi:site-specific DNA-cytosine methylase